MNGAQSRSRPVRFSSTRGVKDVTIEGERLYLSRSKPAGHPVSPSTFSVYGPVSASADKQIEWKPKGYKSYERTVQFATIAHNFVWHDPSSRHPGRWFFYVKSIKLDRQDDGRYDFLDDEALPARPQGSGYRP